MKKGFTLLELIIVIIILGILASIGIPRYFDAIKQARKSEALATLAQIREIEQAYYSVNAAYNTSSVVNGGTVSVDFDGDGSPEMSLTIPNSPNYTYTMSGTTITATKKGAATCTYTMDAASGTWSEACS
ncbi:MAG: prepilin-type N-terminal cleavage/methylation domain-containing protein [Candidatus Omnitrophica bacterium]|nr:prepilin-type N-terminal cleavage/methylation domain-containing protein [Candidatus Omnitrophota bacterium]